MSKRKAETEAESPSWKDSARALEQSINVATAQGKLLAISAELTKLQELATTRLNKMRSVVGLGVVLVDSDESQTVHEVCSRTVNAKFTAGPAQLKFFIAFEYSSDGDCTVESAYEGDTAGLFIIEEGIFGRPATDEEILTFLTLAGLKDAVPTCPAATAAASSAGGLTEELRRKYAFCQIVSEAIALVEDKHGAKDNLRMGLGMGSQDIYVHMFASVSDSEDEDI